MKPGESNNHCFSMLTDIKLAWLAGLLDGEGCIAFARRTDYCGPKRLEVRYDVKLAMTCEMTVRTAYEFLVDIVGEDLVKPPYEERRNVRRVRPLWRCEVSSKRGVYDLLRTLEPHLVTKKIEALLCMRYLERALKSTRHRATDDDRRLAELATALRHGCGEARAEAQALLGQVIPSQAVQGSEPPRSEGWTEGVEATTVTPKENPSQECPAPHSHHVGAEGEEMVRSRGEIPGGGFNGHRLDGAN